ncbi:hypothetical protein BDN70DRAFT_505629 [Pholiota conissans]|uniref:Uncharacterized protein n=1 Tax=Pholiota conissans TaxID=109636 RepID=A0A9P5Z986_9AGAR|nr:hypothetical protein BDN70DRAFT_505629 [Pholiota conissans]
MRLQYARLKVEHGWQKQNLNEVENLYFHNSHLRGSKPYPVPTVVTAQPQPPPFPPPEVNFSQSRLSFRYGPTTSRNGSGILGTEPSVNQVSQDAPTSTERTQAAPIPDHPNSSINMDISVTITAPEGSSGPSVVQSKEDTPSLPTTSTSIPVGVTEHTTIMPDNPTVPPTNSMASMQDGQSSVDVPQSSNNYYPAVKPTRSRLNKPLTTSRTLPSLTAKDMYNFGSTSNLTYDSFWSSHSGSTTPKPVRGHLNTVVPGQYTPTFQVPGDFTSAFQDLSRRPGLTFAPVFTATTTPINFEIPRNPGGPT